MSILAKVEIIQLKSSPLTESRTKANQQQVNEEAKEQSINNNLPTWLVGSRWLVSCAEDDDDDTMETVPGINHQLANDCNVTALA